MVLVNHSSGASPRAAWSAPPSTLVTSRRALATKAMKPLKSAVLPTTEISSSDSSKSWKINLLYDSDCPLCMREVEFLKKRDVNNDIKFTDLTAPDYDPAQNGGVDFVKGMKVIHAVLPDGSTISGVEVFRRVYEVIGLGFVYAVTKIPVVGALADKLYDVWAVNRFRITGRPELEEVLRQRNERIKNMNMDCSDECAL